MQVQIVDNRERKLLPILTPTIEQASEIRVAVAFASRRGLDLLRPALESALTSGATAEFLVGMDMNNTEPDALWQLFQLTKETSSVALYCYASLAYGTIYHPKIYLLREHSDSTVVIGSSNLTPGGLGANIEANVLLKGEELEEPISDSYETYSRLKRLPGRITPDDELLHLYEDVRKETKKQDVKPQQAQVISELTKQFREKANSLRRPTITRADLIGWRGLIYDSLPDGEFTNQQAYSLKVDYKKRFPNNRNIEAKIRQQLQLLEEMGFIEHPARGRWRKK